MTIQMPRALSAVDMALKAIMDSVGRRRIIRLSIQEDRWAIIGSTYKVVVGVATIPVSSGAEHGVKLASNLSFDDAVAVYTQLLPELKN